uniref:ribosomal protein S3 n=1 Tax=Polyozellus multiplex TaxID=281719 RepID=UPI001F13FE65|nr:ribosomal protein S3 [Polyozellus multiplex]UMI33315.1 ribosomal protein S3 [Polyozellus multiplex]
MKIIINKNNLAPIFENVITQKIKIDKSNQIITKENINNTKNNQITLISEKTKPITFKNFFNKSILFVRLYDKHLYLFLSQITNKNKGIFEPKSKENINFIINNNKKTTNNKNTNLSQYGNGKIKMITPIKTNNIQSNFTNTNLTLRQFEISSTAAVLKNEEKEIQPNINKYIKAISMFNSEVASSQNIVYLFNKGNKISSTCVNNNIFSFLEYSFFSMSSLISKPVFVITPSKIIIQLFYYLNKENYFSISKSKFLALNNKKLQLLCLHLSKFYNKPVELELDRLYYPYFDSNILSKMIGLISNTVKFRIIIRKLFSVAKLKNPIKFLRKTRSSLIPSFLSGIKIRLAGRLLTQRVIPRLTVKTIQRGTLARGKAHFVNSARFTNKNRRGVYSITVTMGHIFF